jgi:hypothetical protein
LISSTQSLITVRLQSGCCNQRLHGQLHKHRAGSRGEKQEYSTASRFCNRRARISRPGLRLRRSSEHHYSTTIRVPASCPVASSHSNFQLPRAIQCVGPAEKFCSRICCTEALKNAIALKEQQPEAQVVILYKDIRTYGFKERLYTTAREHGVIFMRYDDDHKPEVAISSQSSVVSIQAWDSVLQRAITLQPDLLVLSMPIVPRSDAHEVAKLFKVPLDADGFFSKRT